MRYAGRIVVGLYAAIGLSAVLWALTTEIHFANSEVEHLLPFFVLAFVTLPLSLTLDPISSAAPSLFDGPFVQIAFLTLCGIVQVSVLWWWASSRAARGAR
jgi:hypothetical protein